VLKNDFKFEEEKNNICTQSTCQNNLFLLIIVSKISQKILNMAVNQR